MSLKQLILAATVATSALSAQASNTFKPEEISRSDPRFSGICELVSKNTTDIIKWKNACEVSTDGGKTWIKAVGGASILAAIGIGALIRIRKRKEEQENTKDENSMFPRESTGSFYKESNTVADPEDNLDDLEVIGVGADIKVDNLSEAEVYAAYGRYKEALELIQIELKKNPENEKAYIKLAGVYKQMKEAAKAVIDKNPTIKDSGLLKELSNFERSLSESELKKLIETAEIGSVPKNEIIVDELDMNRMDEGFRLSADWGEDFQDTKKYMKMVEFIYKRGSKEQFNQFYETTRKMEEAGFFKLSELELSQIKAWGHELDSENPIYKEEGLIIEGHITEIDNTPETILPVEQPLFIAHNEPEPSHITPTEDMFPESKPPVQAKFTSKNQGKLGIHPVLITRLNSLGCSIEKSKDGNSAIVTVIKEGISIEFKGDDMDIPQVIKTGGTYTINDAIGVYHSFRNSENHIMIYPKSGKARFIQLKIQK